MPIVRHAAKKAKAKHTKKPKKAKHSTSQMDIFALKDFSVLLTMEDRTRYNCVARIITAAFRNWMQVRKAHRAKFLYCGKWAAHMANTHFLRRALAKASEMRIRKMKEIIGRAAASWKQQRLTPIVERDRDKKRAEFADILDAVHVDLFRRDRARRIIAAGIVRWRHLHTTLPLCRLISIDPVSDVTPLPSPTSSTTTSPTSIISTRRSTRLCDYGECCTKRNCKFIHTVCPYGSRQSCGDPRCDKFHHYTTEEEALQAAIQASKRHYQRELQKQDKQDKHKAGKALVQEDVKKAKRCSQLERMSPKPLNDVKETSAKSKQGDHKQGDKSLAESQGRNECIFCFDDVPLTHGCLHGESIHVFACEKCIPHFKGTTCPICIQSCERIVRVFFN